MYKFLRSLVSGLRLACFLPVKLNDFETSWCAVWSALVVMSALMGGGDFFNNSPPRLFQITGFGNIFAIFSSVFIAISFVVSALRGQDKLLCLMVVILNGLLLPWAFYMGLYSYLDEWIESRDIHTDLKVIFCCWWFVVALRAVVMVFPHWPARQVPAAALVVAALYVSVHYFPSYFWDHDYRADKKDTDASLRISAEELLQNQHILLDRKLKAVKPSAAGKPIFYGIIFGSTGYQDVFMKEAQFVDGVLTKQFGMTGHTVLMINNDKTARDLPMATATNLGNALKDIGRKMHNPDDIVLLYLTSHGNVETGVSVQMNNAYGLRDVAPKLLADLLHQNGIRNRVVIVSSCYSGVMIDALKSPDTMVITASAKDRTSFGCSDDAELTYFADAYFKQALPQTNNFITAFYLARKLIVTREKNEGIASSEPQIFIGEHIKTVLERHGMRGNDKHP